MEGKNHETLLELILPFICLFLGYIQADVILSIAFIILWKIGTYYITCDWDTKSRSTKRAGFIGWIFNRLFKHRGTLHSPVFWGVLGIAGYILAGWASTGLIIPQFVHIVADKLT
jgi:uncharacterized metal-binding protein